MTGFGRLLVSAEVPFPVGRIVWSPDGSRIAAAQGSGTRPAFGGGAAPGVCVIEAATGLVEWTKADYWGDGAMSFSLDGRHLALGGVATMTRVVDAGSGDPEWSLDGATYGLVYAPDGRLLAVGQESSHLLVDSRTGQSIATLDARPTWPFTGTFGSGSPWFAAGYGERLSLFDLTAGRPVWDVGDVGEVLRLAFTGDGSRLVALTGGGGLLTIDVADGAVTGRTVADGYRQTLATFVSYDCVPVFSPDLRYLAGVTGGDLTLWNVADGSRVRPGTPVSVSGAPSRVSFDAAGFLLAQNSAGDRPGALVQGVATGAIRWTEPSTAVSALAFDPGGIRLAVGGSRFLRVYDTDQAISARTFDTRVSGVSVSDQSIRLAAVASAGKVTLFGADSGDILSEFCAPEPVNAISFSPGGDHYATGGTDGRVRVRETVSGRLLTFSGVRSVNALAYSEAGIVTAGDDGEVRLLSVTTDAITEAWHHSHGRPVRRLAVSPDERWSAFAGADYAVVVLDAQGNQVWRTAHDGRISALSFGALLASGSDDGTVRLIDPRTGPRSSEISHPASVTAVAISTDGTMLVTADQLKEVRVYDTTADPPVLVQKEAAADTVAKLVFHPRDRRLAIAAETQPLVRVVDPDGLADVARLPMPAPVRDLVFGRGGELLAVAGADDVVRVYSGRWP